MGVSSVTRLHHTCTSWCTMLLRWCQDLGPSNHLAGKVNYILSVLIIVFIVLFIGVEKNNDEAKRNYYSSNRHNAAKEIVVTEARLEQLRRDGCVRAKRSYNKTSTQYWEGGGIQQSRQGSRSSFQSTDTPSSSTQTETASSETGTSSS